MCLKFIPLLSSCITCTLILHDEAAVLHRHCMGQMSCASNRQASSVHVPVCASLEHCSVSKLWLWAGTPDLVQRKNKKSVHLPKLPFLRQEKADGCGQAGNKGKQWQYWSVQLCTPPHVVFSCLLHRVRTVDGYLYAGWLSFALG